MKQMIPTRELLKLLRIFPSIANEDVRNWGIDQVDDGTRRQIFAAGDNEFVIYKTLKERMLKDEEERRGSFRRTAV